MLNSAPIDIGQRAQPMRIASPRIAHAALNMMGYEDLISLWQTALTVSPQFIADHPVFCAVQEPRLSGLRPYHARNADLDHLWVEPQHIGTGVGALLFNHAVRTVRSMSGLVLNIASDPHAEAFYLRMGAIRVGKVPSRA